MVLRPSSAHFFPFTFRTRSRARQARKYRYNFPKNLIINRFFSRFSDLVRRSSAVSPAVRASTRRSFHRSVRRFRSFPAGRRPNGVQPPDDRDASIFSRPSAPAAGATDRSPPAPKPLGRLFRSDPGRNFRPAAETNLRPVSTPIVRPIGPEPSPVLGRQIPDGGGYSNRCVEYAQC